MSLGRNPFHAALLIVNNVKSHPTAQQLEALHKFLSNQEDKMTAIAEGMVKSCGTHYKFSLRPEIKDGNVVRAGLLKLMTAAAVVYQGRCAIFKSLGVDTVLGYLKDSDVETRCAACDLLKELSKYPDSSSVLLKGKKAVQGLVNLLIDQEECEAVVCRTIAPLASLAEFDPYLEEKPIAKVIAILKQFSPKAKGIPGGGMALDHEAIALTEDSLKLLLHATAAERQKRIAIDNGVVPTVSIIFDSNEYYENMSRLATAVVLNTSIDEKGKAAAVDCKGCVPALCELACDKSIMAGLRENAVMALRSITENTKGLHQCTQVLLYKPQEAREILGDKRMAVMLSPVFDSEDAEEIRAALKSVELLLKDDKGAGAVWDIVEIIEKLVLSFGKDNGKKGVGNIKKLANTCLYGLCSKNEEACQELKFCLRKVESPGLVMSIAENVAELARKA
mmetsp:Transcript_23081/g.37076  ORF Transcript_23081/g.37076 Transcript_23081/m.37076 type:complete len:449 (+) Transcript_23081:123-1469(+)